MNNDRTNTFFRCRVLGPQSARRLLTAAEQPACSGDALFWQKRSLGVSSKS